MKAAFVGHFAPLSRSLAQASSAAGNQVQRQIAGEVARECEPAVMASYSMTPAPFWPRGPLVSPTLREDGVEFIGFLNLPILKHLVFSMRLLARLLRTRPRLCLQYNSYFFENIALLLYRLLQRGAALAIIIQDIDIVPGAPVLSKRGLRSLSVRASIFMSRFFDMIVPISRAIVDDFGMDPGKCLVFQGGVTDFGASLMSRSEPPDPGVAVFAGALEPHNGIDLLVEHWQAAGVSQVLHVFGRGSLSDVVERAAQRCDRIVCHGFQPEDVVLEWQRRAGWNFCLRYSNGINQTYFFPSKLFNILCAPGVVVVNDFHALPASMKEHLCVVADDLSDLAVKLLGDASLSSAARVDARREIVRAEHSWRTCVDRIFRALQQVPHA